MQVPTLMLMQVPILVTARWVPVMLMLMLHPMLMLMLMLMLMRFRPE